MTPRIVVVGSYVQDLTWRCERFPHPGETLVGTFASGPGGKGSNQAVAAARTGAKVCFIGAVGPDLLAVEAENFHRRERISAHFVRKLRAATGTAAILVDPSGQNQIIVALGANAALAPRDVPAGLLRAAQVVVCQHETNLVVNAHVFRLARRAGATTVLNPAPMRADFDPRILPLTDVLVPNESEFAALAALMHVGPKRKLAAAEVGQLPPEKLHALCRGLGVPNVIVTLGARGCLVSEPGRFTAIAAHRIQVVDTTGAGDAFVGGFAAGLVKFPGDLVRAAHLGNAVAALSVTKPGTAPAMPRAAAIARFLRSSRHA